MHICFRRCSIENGGIEMFSFDYVKDFDPEVAKAMEDELGRQRNNLELIASENLVSEAVMAAMGSHLTNKYAEGYPGKRYYGGCQYVDVVENLAIERAKELFGCEYVNIQPHSGAQANMAVFFAVMNLGDTYMGMNLDSKKTTIDSYADTVQKQNGACCSPYSKSTDARVTCHSSG